MKVFLYTLIAITLTNYASGQNSFGDSNVMEIDTIKGVVICDSIPVWGLLSHLNSDDSVQLKLYCSNDLNNVFKCYCGIADFSIGYQISGEKDCMVVKERYYGVGHWGVNSSIKYYYKYNRNFNEWFFLGSIENSYVNGIEGSATTKLYVGDLNMGIFDSRLNIADDLVKRESIYYQKLLAKNINDFELQYKVDSGGDLSSYSNYESLLYLLFVPKDSNNYNLFLKLSHYLEMIHKCEEAKNILENLLNWDVKDSSLYLTLGNLYWKTNKEKAIEYYEQYLSGVNGGRISNLTVSKRIEETNDLIEKINKCMQLISKDCDGCIDGSLLEKLECLEWCVNIEDNVVLYNDLAYYLEQYGLYSKSVFLIEKIVEKYPNRTVAYINLGDAYWGLNENTKAKEAYNKYIELMKANGKESKIPQRVLDRVR